MKRKKVQKFGGYGLLVLALALLIGPTLFLAHMHKPQMVALRVIEDQPIALSAISQYP